MKNRNSHPPFRLPTIIVLTTILCTLPLASEGQVPKGEPIIATGSSTSTPSPSSIDAFVYSSTGDMCARILFAWNSFPNANPGVVVDARAFTGPQTCSASPFPALTPKPRYGVLLLGNVQIATSVTWNIPSRVRVQGIGSQGGQGTGSGTQATLIYAGSGFPTTGAPVVQLGNPDSAATKAYQSQVANLTIDCLGVTGCTGLLNDSAEEASYAENIIVFNAPVVGVHVTSASTVVVGGAGNSGPYRNISVQFTTCSTCSSAVGLQVDGQNKGYVIRGFDNFTVSGLISGSGISGPGVLIFGAPTQFTNSHVEFFGPGIQIGNTSSAYGTANVQVQNVNIADNGSNWDVLIQSSTSEPVGDVLLVGINNASINNQILDDTVTGNEITGANLGFYLLGDVTTPASNTAVVSTSPTNAATSTALQWVDPGSIHIVGNLSKGSGTFEIDHPLDPTNKYLYHSFVESPDMMNVYNGNATTDRDGLAVVTLPKYFEALNKDFRYQLTAMGSFAQVTIAKEIHNNQFTIRTNKPGVKVSWQVTGVRHDAYAERNPIQVEEEKSPRDRGHYLHPNSLNGNAGQQTTK